MKEVLPYISEEKCNELLHTVGHMMIDRAGSNSKAYLIDNYCVLKTGNIELKKKDFDGVPFDEVLAKVNTLANNGINAVRILGYAFEEKEKTSNSPNVYAEGYIIQDRARGSELWDRDLMPRAYSEPSEEQLNYLYNRLLTLASAPQSHYDKFVSDYKAITDNLIMIDPSKKTNFFYDKEFGFSFIDLNFLSDEKLWDKPDLFGDHNHRDFIRYCYLPCLNYIDENTMKYLSDTQKQELIQYNNAVFNKVSTALQAQGITQEQIDEALSEQKTYQATSSSVSIFGVTSDDKDIVLPQNLAE